MKKLARALVILFCVFLAVFLFYVSSIIYFFNKGEKKGGPYPTYKIDSLPNAKKRAELQNRQYESQKE